MIIANPIYDVVFKRLMENEKVAKFFIGTLLDQTIEAVEVKSQEFTFVQDLDLTDPAVQAFVEEKIRERLAIHILRLDFIATIKTESGDYKKVLIEIQKARNLTDLMRFRNYLAEQYKKEDTIDREKVVLPITTIYVLGFNLPDIQSPCIKVNRIYEDLVEKTIIDKKSEFIEKLTHDCYVVQVHRIRSRYQTRLDKLLSLFEQTHFLDETNIIKNYPYLVDLEEVKLMADILHYAGTEPEERKKIEIEQEAWRTINAMIADTAKALADTTKALVDTENALEEKDKELTENQKILAEKEMQTQELLQQLEELKRKLGE